MRKRAVLGVLILILGTAVALIYADPTPVNAARKASSQEQLGPCKRFVNRERLPRWCPCKPIRYSIDPVGAPSGWTQDIHDAFRAAAQYSKIPVNYVGTWPHGRAHQDSSDPILLYYTNGSVVGGGYAEPYIDNHTIKGGVVMLSTYLALDRYNHRRVIYHEIGHMYGIQHPNPLTNSAVMGTGGAPYRAYDIYGFALFGKQNTDC